MSGDDTPTREWVLMGMADSGQLGSPERLMELEKMKQRKTERGMTTVYLLLKPFTSIFVVYKVNIKVAIYQMAMSSTGSIHMPSTQ